LITLIDLLNNLELNWPGLWEKVKKLFVKKKTAPIIVQETEKTEKTGEQQNGLIEIKKENVSQPQKERISPEKRVYEILYIVSFLGLAFRRVSGILRVLPYAHADNYHSSIVDAVLLLILPCAAALYLKMMKGRDSRPANKISGDILKFFSYISFIYAAVIAASSVLKINILIVLQWVYYAASIYLVISLGINILHSYLKGNILNFDYSQ
jgi:hypothetical protein